MNEQDTTTEGVCAEAHTSDLEGDNARLRAYAAILEQEHAKALNDFRLAHEHLMRSEKRLQEKSRQYDIEQVELTEARRALRVSRAMAADAELISNLLDTLRNRGFTVLITGQGSAEVQISSAVEHADLNFVHFADTLPAALEGAARTLLAEFQETARLVAAALRAK